MGIERDIVDFSVEVDISGLMGVHIEKKRVYASKEAGR
jgi:hypothetical protein